jgi:hypothetical protein
MLPIASNELPNDVLHRRLLSLEETVGRQDRRLARIEALVSRFSEFLRMYGPDPSGALCLISSQQSPPASSVARASITFPVGFSSAILTAFPPIFDKFKSKQFSLLWRGNRDGFRAHAFHERCDGHENTLTIVLDTKDNVFGGFTPVSWESRTEDLLKSDRSFQSFIFFGEESARYSSTDFHTA